jgi:hypothetical protein
LCIPFLFQQKRYMEDIGIYIYIIIIISLYKSATFVIIYHTKHTTLYPLLQKYMCTICFLCLGFSSTNIHLKQIYPSFVNMKHYCDLIAINFIIKFSYAKILDVITLHLKAKLIHVNEIKELVQIGHCQSQKVH